MALVHGVNSVLYFIIPALNIIYDPPDVARVTYASSCVIVFGRHSDFKLRLICVVRREQWKRIYVGVDQRIFPQ